MFCSCSAAAAQSSIWDGAACLQLCGQSSLLLHRKVSNLLHVLLLFKAASQVSSWQITHSALLKLLIRCMQLCCACLRNDASADYDCKQWRKACRKHDVHCATAAAKACTNRLFQICTTQPPACYKFFPKGAQALCVNFSMQVVCEIEKFANSVQPEDEVKTHSKCEVVKNTVARWLAKCRQVLRRGWPSAPTPILAALPQPSQ